MSQIVLTEDQARVLAGAEGPVEVLDPAGQPLASMAALSPEHLEALRKGKLALASGEPSVPGEQVQALLQEFDEIDERQGLDREKAERLLDRLLVGDPS